MPFTLTMPKLSPTMEEGTIAKWHKKEGEAVDAGELLFEVSTDKATVEYNALDAGVLKKILVQEGGDAKVNQPVAIFTESQEESIEGYEPEGIGAFKAKQELELSPEKKLDSQEKAASPKNEESPLPLSSHTQERLLASPLAKKIAREKNIDLSQIKGSGPNQRIMSRDLESSVKDVIEKAKEADRPQQFGPREPVGSYTEETLSQMRKVIAKRLQEAKATIPHIYIDVKVNADQLVQFRNQLSELDVKVSVNDCIIKACAIALKKHPVVNSGFNAANNTILRFQTIDIAVAVSIKEGLITPIVRYADYKSLQEISREIRDLATRAKAGKLKLEEFQGGSFSVSNLGMFGVSSFQAIINPPQAALLAISSIQNVPIVKDHQIVPGKQFHMTLSCDHRVIDGVDGAKFLQTLKEILENPVALLL